MDRIHHVLKLYFYFLFLFQMVNYKKWPKWLEFDKSGVMKGVPLSRDVGIYYLVVLAVAPQSLSKSKDIFAIEVIKPGLDTRLPEDPIKVSSFKLKASLLKQEIFFSPFKWS